MKVRLRCKAEEREKIAAMLERGGFMVSEDGIYLFYEPDYMPDYMVGRTADDNGDLVMLRFPEILYFESYGHEISMVTAKGTFHVKERMYQLDGLLPPQMFSRVNKSVIVNRSNIKRISPGIGKHYFLTMKNDVRIDVTRNYYMRFKAEVGI